MWTTVRCDEDRCDNFGLWELLGICSQRIEGLLAMLCAPDDPGKKLGNSLDFCFCVLPSQGETDESVRLAWFETERENDMRGFEGT